MWLGSGNGFAYRGRVIGVLRFLGVLNAAIWLGTLVFVMFGAIPAMGSDAMKSLLGSANYPYYSGAVSRIVEARGSIVLLACSLLALIHVAAEWLYLGRILSKPWRWVVSGLVGLSLLCVLWVQPRLQKLHTASHAVNLKPDGRLAAAGSFRVWRKVYWGSNLLLICGVSAYLWRLTNAPEGTRFVSAVKFRS